MAIVGGQGTQNVQVKALSSSASTATITATVSTGCETLTFNRSVTTGLPTITSLALNGNSSFPQAVNPNSNYTLSASTNDPSSTYSFSVVGGSGNMNVSLSQSGSNCGVYVTGTSGSKYVRVTVTNSCGSYSEDVVLYIPSGYRAYPVPAKDVLTVEFTDTQEKFALPDEMYLVGEEQSETVRRVNISEVYERRGFRGGNKIDFDIRNLPRGTYYLKVVNSRLEVSKRTETIRVLFQ